jgi:hypothetical protein
MLIHADIPKELMVFNTRKFRELLIPLTSGAFGVWRSGTGAMQHAFASGLVVLL